MQIFRKIASNIGNFTRFEDFSNLTKDQIFKRLTECQVGLWPCRKFYGIVDNMTISWQNRVNEDVRVLSANFKRIRKFK